jgi:hypothetical protein
MVFWIIGQDRSCKGLSFKFQQKTPLLSKQGFDGVYEKVYCMMSFLTSVWFWVLILTK